MRKKIKLAVVFGTRPEAIKLAPLILQAHQHNEIELSVFSTGQHREMLLTVFRDFGFQPDINLDIMTANQSLTDLTARLISELSDVLAKHPQDLVLVHGDTTTCLSASIAAFYNRTHVGHVEAGLRTNDLMAPWPEELNRQLVSRIASLNFAPTDLAAANLSKENIVDGTVHITGNTVIDALFLAREKITSSPSSLQSIDADIKLAGYDLSRNKPFILITAHRRENFGDGIKQICSAILSLAKKHSEFDFVYPVHLNPNIEETVRSSLDAGNIFLPSPLAYLEFVRMMGDCYLVLTDSGGIQEEAPSLGKPVLVMRDNSERPEATIAGTAKLVGADANQIVKGVSDLIEDKSKYTEMANSINPYGDGTASEKILKEILIWNKNRLA